MMSYYECPPDLSNGNAGPSSSSSANHLPQPSSNLSRVSPVSESDLDPSRFDSASDANEPPTVGYCNVLYDFDARFEDELSVKAGYVVRVIQLYDEWAQCWNPIGGKQGLIPISYLQVFLDEDDSDTQPTTPCFETGDMGGFSMPNGMQQLDFSSLDSSPSFYQQPPSEASSSFYAAPPSQYDLTLSEETPRAAEPTPKQPSTNPYQSWVSFGTDSMYPSLPTQQQQNNSLNSWLEAPTTSTRDSGNNSMSSGTTEPHVEPKKEDNLGDFMELFGMKPPVQPKSANNGQGNDSVDLFNLSTTPPPRPPLPQRPILPIQKEIIQPLRVAPQRPGSVPAGLAPKLSRGFSPDWQTKLSKVVEELLNSEIQYSTELHVWERCVTLSTLLNEQQKCILTNGYPMLRDLAQHMVRSISEQCDKAPEHQCYGKMFMLLRDKLNRTYAYYFRCVEEITQIIETKSTDPQIHDALTTCLQQMRDEGVFVFDVTTAVVRPIQRCLKYPLFISEILKVLPLTHVDHPKLLEANKQMQALVTKMNESKRRKELMKKYRDDNLDKSLTSKLSKLNLHTLQKKSNRLKYRIANSIGLTSKPDPEYCQMIADLETAERRLCKLIYNIHIYRMRITFMTKKYISFTLVDTKKFRMPADEPLRWEFNAYLKLLEVFLSNHIKQVLIDIVTPCQDMRKAGYAKWIEKRNDKLADLQTGRARKCTNEEIDKFRGEFEALNTHVKGNLPKIYTAMNEHVTKTAKTMINMDTQYFDRVNAYLNHIPEKLKMFTIPDYARFVDSGNHRLSNFKKHLKALDIAHQQQMKLVNGS